MKFSYPNRALAVALFVAAQAHAQQVPDAGSLLREQPKPPALTPAPTQPTLPARPAADSADTGARVQVKGFRIEGALLISEAELVTQIKSAIGRELSFAQLQDLTTALTDYYGQRGFLARVILPPQDLKDGIVRYEVIEGRRGGLQVDNEGDRISTARVERMIDGRMPRGKTMDIAALGEALNIVNDQPGIDAKSSLSAGERRGDVDITVTTVDKPLATFGLNANNQGSRGTGELQAGASVSLANPSGHFDAASLLINSSDGTTYARADYSIAVGDMGMRVGVNASDLRYHLTQATFAALQANGTARTMGATASYPIARRKDFGLTLSGSLDQKFLLDRTITGETGNREVTVGSIALNGYALGTPQSFLGESSSNFGITLTSGHSDQRNAAALAADSATRQTQGGFTKIGYSAANIRQLASRLILNLSLRGQFAGKNLESTERFSLGGPSGVRAYPVGESGGDEGWLASVSLGYKSSDTLMFNVFLDSGSVTLNRNLYANWNAANPNLTNRYKLSGVGAGMDWRFSPNALLALSIATPLGSNPGRDTNNLNADGRRNSTRGWVSLNTQF